MKQDREFRRGFRFHFAVMGAILAAFVVIGIVAFTWSDDDDPASPIPPAGATPVVTPAP